jgi:uncharacterized membrane protein
VGGKRFKKRTQLAPYRPQEPPIQSITRVQSVAFAGPLPPPEILAKFNDVVPGAADRIIAMAERQSSHREGLEKSVIDANIASQKRGSIFAFILCLLVILGGFYLIAHGKDGWGFAAILGALASLAGVFIYGKKKEEKELEEKSDALAKRMDAAASKRSGQFE